MDLNWVAIVVAAVAVFFVSTGYYIVFGGELAAARAGTTAEGRGDSRPAPWQIGTELVRSLVLAAVVAWLSAGLGITDVVSALGLGLALWVAFPVVLWTGAILWEGTSPRLAAVHAGDWLLKLVVIAIVVGLWW